MKVAVLMLLLLMKISMTLDRLETEILEWKEELQRRVRDILNTHVCTYLEWWEEAGRY